MNTDSDGEQEGCLSSSVLISVLIRVHLWLILFSVPRWFILPPSPRRSREHGPTRHTRARRRQRLRPGAGGAGRPAGGGRRGGLGRAPGRLGVHGEGGGG